MNSQQLRELASIYMDRANSAETGAEAEAWVRAAGELSAAARGVDVVAEAVIASGYCSSCGEELTAPAGACAVQAHRNAAADAGVALNAPTLRTLNALGKAMNLR